MSVYFCLEDSTSVLVEHAASTVQTGRAAVAETLTMPRKRFGSRPVLVLSAVDLTLYNALVASLSSVLGEPSRSQENFATQALFGVPEEGDDAAHHIVSTDIAAFYEYINHHHLRAELSLRSADPDVMVGLLALLESAYGEPRGVPQLLDSSDHLADAYLGSMDRALMRTGWPMMRVADDFKIRVSDWASALHVIEEAAHAAREIGLVLSTEKTTVLRADTARDQRKRDQDFLVDRLAAAGEQLRADRFLSSPYDDDDPSEPGTDERMHEAFHQIIQEWASDPARKPRNARWLTAALRVLRNANERVDDSILSEVVFRFPVYLEFVCRYVQARESEGVENWQVLAQLVSMDRQSPWAVIWLLNTFGNLEVGMGGPDEAAVVAWARNQLAHDSEVVRAEAAWCLAVRRSVDIAEIAHLYSSATLLSRPSLAASAGRVEGESSSSQEVKALKGENNLMRAAIRWGSKSRESA